MTLRTIQRKERTHMSSDVDVVIVGSGLTGLACALQLQQWNVPFLVLEAQDGVGGRVRTDKVDGFLLDRGFQVLLTAYPECQRVLDYEALDLKPFYPGALVRIEGKFHRVADFWRRPLAGVGTLFAPVGSIVDKFRVNQLRNRVRKHGVDELFSLPETTTAEHLRSFGFSEQMIDRFFRPFFSGIFLEEELKTSSRMFDFVFRMFSDGDTSVPSNGMQAIPEQMASKLPPNSIRIQTRVSEIEESGLVHVEGGDSIQAKAVVIATDGSSVGELVEGFSTPAWRSVCCLYYAAEKSPVSEAILVLNGEGRGPVNNFSVMSDVSANYAPSGSALLSASVLGNPEQSDEELEMSVRAHLREWYGEVVSTWKHLRTYRIKHALPEQFPPALQEPQRSIQLRPGLYVCGDHRDNASINGAMVSGRRTAEAELKSL